jgi:hypothetical protein
VPALILGGVERNHAALQDYSALGFVLSQDVSAWAGHGIAPDSFEGPAQLIAVNAGMLEADIDVFVGAHDEDPGWGVHLYRKRFLFFVPKSAKKVHCSPGVLHLKSIFLSAYKGRVR